MTYFIGIAPPADLSNTIAALQKQYGDNRTEPHITLRRPTALSAGEQWLETVREVANNFEPFDMALISTGCFGKRVLFIEVVSDALHLLQQQLVNALKPFESLGKNYKENPFHAHLTLGRLNVGFTPAGLQLMNLQAEGMIDFPVTFTASFIRVYHKPVINERYKVLEDVGLRK